MKELLQGNRILTCAVLLASFAFVACDSTDVTTTDGEIDRIRILPDSASMAVGETLDFSVVGVTASNDTVRDVNFDVRWWSTDSTVFDVSNEGLAIAHDAGTAYCMVEVNELGKTAARFTGRDSAFVVVHLF